MFSDEITVKQGTIGGFFHYKGETFAITAAHCFDETDKKLSTVAYIKDQTVDIALFPTKSHHSIFCAEFDKGLHENANTLQNLWEALENLPEGITVYKVGASTGLTKGLISSLKKTLYLGKEEKWEDMIEITPSPGQIW